MCVCMCVCVCWGGGGGGEGEGAGGFIPTKESGRSRKKKMAELLPPLPTTNSAFFITK